MIDTTPTPTPTAGLQLQRDRSRRLAVVIGGVAPVMLAAIGTLLMASWIPQLPDPIAVHWSGRAPDGYGSAVLTILLPLIVIVAFSAFAVGAAWRTTEAGLLAWNQKFVLATSIWFSVMLTVSIGGTIAIQRGLADASEAGDITMLIPLGAAAGFLLAIPAWFLLPKTDASEQSEREPDQQRLAASDRVSWSRDARLAPAIFAAACGALALAAVAVLVTISAAPAGSVFAISAFVVVLLLVIMTSSWRVSTDERGLIVRSAVGWPRIVIPLADIRDIHVVNVNPAAHFGGWGWRWGAAGRTGIVLRAGDAIQVTRSSGKRVVVTVDDAETGAAVLATLVSRLQH